MSETERRNVETIMRTIGPDSAGRLDGRSMATWALTTVAGCRQRLEGGPASGPRRAVWHQIAREMRLAATALLSSDLRTIPVDAQYWGRIRLLKQEAKALEDRCSVRAGR